MRLMDYLKSEALTFTAFAKLIGTKHPRTVERYAKGTRIPSPKMMNAITRETSGKVTANDFFAPAAE